MGKKKPSFRWAFPSVETELLLRADHFNVNAAVRLLAGDLCLASALARLRINLQLALALAFRVDTVGFDALADQVALDAARRTDRRSLYLSEPNESVWPTAITTSRLMPCSFETRSSSLALPSGFSTALSKSNSVSAAKVTFSLVGATAAGAAGVAAVGAAAGARAPSHCALAVAGVHCASTVRSCRSSRPTRSCRYPSCR